MENKGDTAGIILYNGRIFIGSESRNIKEAIAVKDGRILNSGTNNEILALKEKKTRLIDLKGRLVIPGLIESHAHFSWAALSECHGELFSPTSVKELLEHIQERAKAAPKGEWLYYGYIYPVRLKELRYPSLEELDAVASEHPVYIDGVYAGQANSCALKTAGLDENTVLQSGRLCRDKSTGKLNGILFACSYLIKKFIPAARYSEEEILKGYKILQHQYNRLGITSVIDGMTTPSDITICNQLYRQGQLNLRFIYTCTVDEPDDIVKRVQALSGTVETPDEWGKLSYLKVLMDGGILTGTAYMRKPYGSTLGIPGVIDGNFKGILSMRGEKAGAIIEKAFDTGLQMTAHCIGDAALDILLTAYEKIERTSPFQSKRFAVIHADFTDAQTIERLKKLGLTLISQPAWHYKDGVTLNRILDNETMDSFLPYRTLLESEIPVCGGSDHMVKWDPFLATNPYNPFIGLYNLVTRKTGNGEAIHPEQSISREEALRMYTLNGAYATFDENLKGTLENGKYADMVVLSKDYFTCDEEEIPQIESELTIVGGRIVYMKGK